MIETLIIAAPIAVTLLLWRHGLSTVPQIWRALTWYERVLLVFCFAPLPGPLDEIGMALLVGRGLKRLRETTDAQHQPL